MDDRRHLTSRRRLIVAALLGIGLGGFLDGQPRPRVSSRYLRAGDQRRPARRHGHAAAVISWIRREWPTACSSEPTRSTNTTAFHRCRSSRKATDGTSIPSQPALRSRVASSRQRSRSRIQRGSSGRPAAIRIFGRRRSTAASNASVTCQSPVPASPSRQCLPTSASATPRSPARYSVGCPVALHRLASVLTMLATSKSSLTGPEQTATEENGAPYAAPDRPAIGTCLLMAGTPSGAAVTTVA